jgi:type II secretory pathway component PulF
LPAATIPGIIDTDAIDACGLSTDRDDPFMNRPDDDDLTPYELDPTHVPSPRPSQGSTFRPSPGHGDDADRPSPPRAETTPKRPSAGQSTFRPAQDDRPRKPQRPAEPSRNRAEAEEFDGETSFRPLKSKRKRDDIDDDDAFAAGGGPSLIERIFFGRVGTKQLALFYRQFGQYLSAGMDVPQSLRGLQKHFAGRALGPVIARMTDAVKSGRSLTESFEREPQAFDRLAVNMIRAAEARGAVPEILAELAEVQEFRARTIRNIASASIYPILVLGMATICLLVIAVFVGPLFNGILQDMIPANKRDGLILPTRMLFAFNSLMMALGPLMPIFLLIGTVVGIWAAYKTKAGRTLLDEIYWYVPVFGKIQKYVDISRMGRMLGALLEAGVSTPDALGLTAGVVRLKPFERVLEEAERATREGDEISPVFAASGRFPFEVIGLIETGETTGNLPKSLTRMATDFEERATVMIKSLSTLIQPMITIALGLIVGFIAIAFVGLIAGLFSSLSSGF